MGLGMYREVSTGVYSMHLYDTYAGGETLLPIISTHDGILGETIELKLFIRNDDSTEYYENISLLAVSTTSEDDVIGTATGHGVKLSAGSTQPTEAQWDAIDYGNTITFSDIGESGLADTSSYLPFWYRTEVPAGAPADNKENVVLRLSYTANPV